VQTKGHDKDGLAEYKMNRGGTCVGRARERKMDRGRGYTELVIRKIEIEALCPLRHALLLKQHAEDLGTNDSLFCSDDGKPYAQPAQLSRLLKTTGRRGNRS
jgi:hypothetical protein